MRFIGQNKRALWLLCRVLVFVLVVSLPTSRNLNAQEKASEIQSTPVRVVPIPLPISGDVDEHVASRVRSAVSWLRAKVGESQVRPVLVLEFAPKEPEEGVSSKFSRCLDLARFLAGDDLAGIRLIAWVNGDLRGHAILPVLACEELIVSEEGRIGQAGAGETNLEGSVIAGYEEIASKRRLFPSVLVRGMLQRGASIVEVKTIDGVRYAFADEVPKLEREVAVSSIETLTPQGEMASFPGDVLRNRLRIASHLASDRNELAQAIGVTPASMQENPLATMTVRPVRYVIDGPIQPKIASRAIRCLKDEMEKNNANLLLLELRSQGGSVSGSLSLARFFFSEVNHEKVRSIVFVRDRALADSLLIAMGADELVVQSGARVGGEGGVSLTSGDLDDTRTFLREVAQDRGAGWSYPQALLGEKSEIFRFESRSGEKRSMSAQEQSELKQPEKWTRGAQVNSSDGALGRELLDAGIATHNAESLAELQRIYGISGEINVAKTNWALALVEKLAEPELAGFLLLVGMIAFYIELSTPGIGVPGFVACVCLMLFFWANFLHGTADWLEILLFVAGLTCILVELFLLPGTLIFGFGGGVMVILSIILASQTFVWPANTYQLNQLPSSLGVFTFISVLALVVAGTIRQFLPRTPYLNRLLLKPPEGDQLAQLEQREATASFEDLIGMRGEAMTLLIPAGKAQFGDRVVDVMSDGEPIDAGAQVKVIEVMGARVVVQRAR